jgi:hypothetical protein
MSRTRALLIGMAALAVGGAKVGVADTLYGEAQKLGNGFARLYVELDAAGAPAVLGVTFDQGMLEGLPTMPNTWSRCFDRNGNGQIDPHGECHGDYELELALPQELAGVTPFSWVSVNWNPMGHMPPPRRSGRRRTTTSTSTSCRARRCGRSGRAPAPS